MKKSKRLIVFGDSFASLLLNVPVERNKGTIWFVELAKHLGLELKNYAYPGSSFEYSLREFGNYISTIEYREDDIIIFVLTSQFRSPILSDEIPPNYAGYLTAFLDGSLAKDHPAYSHYYKNKEMYESLYLNHDRRLADTQRKNLILALKSIPNFSVLMTAFESSYDVSERNDVNKLCKSDDGFLLIPTNLYSICEDEIIDAGFIEFRNHFNGDNRNCHLCNTNNAILAKQIYSCIENKTEKCFDASEYKKQFISLKEYDEELYIKELPYYRALQQNKVGII